MLASICQILAASCMKLASPQVSFFSLPGRGDATTASAHCLVDPI